MWILLYGATTRTTTKSADSKIQVMEMKCFKAILNKTKVRIKNTNISLELGVHEIKTAD